MADWGGDEAELVRRCREGSDAAYAALVRLHRPRLFALAYRLTGDRTIAEDVTQETFLAAFKAIDRFEPKPSIGPWLNRIAIRIAARVASKRTPASRVSLDGATTAGADGDAGGGLGSLLIDADPTADPSAAAEAAELRQEVAHAIEALPFNYRAAVVLRYIVGLDYAEAAAAMDVPLNTFKSHLLRGTRMLRNELTERLDAEAPARPVVPAAPAVPPPAHASPRPSPGELPYAAVGSEGLARH